MKCLFALFLFILLGCQHTPRRIQSMVRSGENEIHYSSIGEGPAIVFIHGGGVDQHMWQAQIAALAADFQVITYDLRGHGKSAYKNNELYDIEDLKAILDESGLKQAHLAGLSLGAMIAIDFIMAYPEYVDKLVLMSPGLAGIQEQDMSYLGPIIELGQALQKNDIKSATDIVEKITFYGRGERSLPASMDTTVAYVRKAFASYIESGNYTRPPKLKETAPASRLADIDKSTLIIHGLEDAAYIENNVEVLHEGISASTISAIPAAAHLVNIEAHLVVNKLLNDFLDHQ
ncbi:MAG: alpha/beta hydrolase [Roseivirga sp.]|nr:alpha/beta hydrolase [Roseivirga sp.]